MSTQKFQACFFFVKDNGVVILTMLAMLLLVFIFLIDVFSNKGAYEQVRGTQFEQKIEIKPGDWPIGIEP